jgi:uncharacterized DUF497 family protein
MRYTWRDDKNELLRKTRRVSFEQVVQAIANGQLVDVLENPNQRQYAGQIFLLVRLDRYIYVVPATLDTENEHCRLITIYPSRKYTRRYLEERPEL